MAWGCFVGEIKGPLVFCNEYKEKKEKIKAKTYLKILENNFIPFHSAMQSLVSRNIVFQQDNAPTQWFKEKNVTIMDWPASSPDLNPIENVWKLMKDNIQKHKNFRKP